MEGNLESVETIPQLLGYAAERYTAATAIIEEDGSSLTYKDLHRAVQHAARAFLAKGVVLGDRVAIWAPNRGEWIIAAAGLQMAGAVLVPLNTRLKGREAAYILQKSGAKLLVTVRNFLGVDYPALLQGHDLPQLEEIILFDSKNESESWEKFLVKGEARSPGAVRQQGRSLDGADLSDIMFTSGTTGNPKGVMTTHKQNLRVYGTYSGQLGLREGDRYLIANPFFHVFGYKAGWLSAIIRGVTIYPHAVFDASTILARIQRERITFLPGPPTIYQSMLAVPNLKEFDLTSLRIAITGAAMVPVELIRRMHSDLGFGTVLTAYGLTETCGTATMCTEADDPETIANTCGVPIEGVELRTVGEDNHPVPVGSPGEVVIRGYNVMKGYFGDPDETGRAIDAEGWLHTGDIGIMNDRGYLKITDRKKDMFIVGGFNCYPAEIENILHFHPAILQAAIIGVPDSRLGEVGKAFVVLKPGAKVAPDEIVAWSRENMANYKAPRFVEILDKLPTNAAGKVQKFLLRN